MRRFCQHQKCNYKDVIAFYRKQLDEQFGINHLIFLLAAENEEEVALKNTFRIFLKWFLREKYMLYLLKNGKMGDKESYVDYKNKTLLYIEIIELGEQ